MKTTARDKALEISRQITSNPTEDIMIRKACLIMHEWTKNEIGQWLLNNACNYMFCTDDTIDEYYFDDKQMVSDLIKFLEQ